MYCCLAGPRRLLPGRLPHSRLRRRGLGFLPLLLAAGGQAASSVMGGKAAKDAADAAQAAADAQLILAARQQRSEEASSRLAQAQSQGGQVIRYALYGLGGLLLVGAGAVWILTRKKGA